MSRYEPQFSRSPSSKALWAETGRQDARNIMDRNELEEDLGPNPTQAQIKAWLYENVDIDDMDFSDYPQAERPELFDAWAAGWAGWAEHVMRHPTHRSTR